VRLFGGRLEAGRGDGEPGTVLGLEADRLLLAARGGRLSVSRVRVGDGPKQAAAECGLAAGDRLT
jgi:hypothetical protein